MPPSNFREYIEEIRRAADIAEVIGETVKLIRAGNALVGLCPFHQEKTPSFRVSPDKGVFHCFGCQAGGDVFTYVAELHGVGFTEAAALLGERYGIARPRGRAPGEDVTQQRRKKVLEALVQTQRFFEERLWTTEGAQAREYLLSRGLSEEQAKAYGLGWAPEAWDRLLRHLAGRNFSAEELAEAGLVVPRQSGGFYDRFRGRVTFPIRDTAGRVVSFGGRALGEQTPKYLNGPETRVYDKSRTLFRLSEVAREVRSCGQIVIVEGYFDAIALAAAGIPSVVAVCGTALGPAHADLIRRWADRAVLFFDGDAAGRRAALRGLGVLLQAGIGVRVATPPAGKDPDDLARSGGAPAVEACLGQALDLPDFLVEQAKQEFDTQSLEGRVSAVEMILEHLVLLPSSLARAEAAGRVAAGLGIEDELVLAELKRAARQRRRQFRPPEDMASGRSGGAFRVAEAAVIRYLGGPPPEAEREQARQLIEELPLEGLGAPARVAVQRWLAAAQRGESWDLRHIAEAVESSDRKEILALAFSSDAEPKKETFLASLASLREAALKARLKEVQEELDRATDTGQQDRLMAEKFALAQQIRGMRPVGRAGAGG